VFTLIELLVVVDIIGILVTFAIPAFFDNINKAKVANLLKDYETIKYGVLQNYSDNNEFTNTNRPRAISTHGYLSDQKNIEKNFDHKIDKSLFGGRYYIQKNDKENTVKVYIELQTKEDYEDY
jgi:prepilin-type N-terminal cleavage/methylation domain-containing protein